MSTKQMINIWNVVVGLANTLLWWFLVASNGFDLRVGAVLGWAFGFFLALYVWGKERKDNLRGADE